MTDTTSWILAIGLTILCAGWIMAGIKFWAWLKRVDDV